jgi:hypothetical protein
MHPVGLHFMLHQHTMMLNLSVYFSIVVLVLIQLIIKVIHHLNGHVKQVHEMYLLILKVKEEKNLIHQQLNEQVYVQVKKENICQNLPHYQHQQLHLLQMMHQHFKSMNKMKLKKIFRFFSCQYCL